jgi:hypothetical protein
MANEILVAIIGLGGVLLGGTVQWIVARSTIRSETERLHRQLSTEFRLQQFSEWQAEFRSVISELLGVTDPEVQREFRKDRVIPLILKAQLMLNPQLPAHARVNGLINQLALAVNGWHGTQDAATVLRIHGELLDASRNTLFLPGS